MWGVRNLPFGVDELRGLHRGSRLWTLEPSLECHESSRQPIEISAGRFRCCSPSTESLKGHGASLSPQWQDAIMRFGGSTSPKMPWPVT